MFDKIKFANILKKINDTYDNQVSFAKVSDVNRTYLSQYINMKLDNPPSPKVLKGIAYASNGIVSYSELMKICGYIDLIDIYMQPIDKNINCIPLLYSFDFSNDNPYNENFIIDYIPFDIDTEEIDNYFAFQTNDDTMLPLFGVGDIAIIKKETTYESGYTYLFSIDDNDVMIRKIIDFNDYIELQTAFPYSPSIKLTKEEMKSRNFKVLGRVIKAENESAFK